MSRHNRAPQWRVGSTWIGCAAWWPATRRPSSCTQPTASCPAQPNSSCSTASCGQRWTAGAPCCCRKAAWQRRCCWRRSGRCRQAAASGSTSTLPPAGACPRWAAGCWLGHPCQLLRSFPLAAHPQLSSPLSPCASSLPAVQEALDDVPIFAHPKLILGPDGCTVEALELTYITLYAHNGAYRVGGVGLIKTGDHDGDWEHCTARWASPGCLFVPSRWWRRRACCGCGWWRCPTSGACPPAGCTRLLGSCWACGTMRTAAGTAAGWRDHR